MCPNNALYVFRLWFRPVRRPAIDPPASANNQSNHSKQAATGLWNQLGFTGTKNPDEFGIDLLVSGKGKEFGCEVEVKIQWHEANFTIPTLHIALRKRKFMSGPSQFMVFNQGITHAALVNKTLISSVQSLKLRTPQYRVENSSMTSQHRTLRF